MKPIDKTYETYERQGERMSPVAISTEPVIDSWSPCGVPSTDDELLKDMCASKHMSIDEIISEGNAFRSHYAAKVADISMEG